MNTNLDKSHSKLALMLGIYCVMVGLCTLYLIYVLLTGEIFEQLLQSEDATKNSLELLLISAFITMLGGVLGSVLHNLIGLHVHAVIKADFIPRFAGSYLLGPFGAAFLALAMFCVIQGGLLALSGDISQPDNLVRSSLFYMAIGIITGFAFDTVIIRIDSVAKQLFGAERESFLEYALKTSSTHNRPSNEEKSGD